MFINGGELWPNAQFFLSGNNFPVEILEKEGEKELLEKVEEIFPVSPILPLREENNVGTEINERNAIFEVNHINRRRRAFYKDNIIIKIQAHFFYFLIGFCNDALKAEYKYSLYSFKKINHSKSKLVHKAYISQLKNSKIKDLLNFEISRKYSRFDKFENKKLLEKIIPSSEWLSHLFDMNYLDLFKYYYNKEKPLNKIYFENKAIVFSPETKSFYFLLERCKDFKQDIIDITKKMYLNENDD